MATVRYYSVERPIGFGTYPRRRKATATHNFGSETFVCDIGRTAFGWVEYEEPLSDKQADKYELVRSRSK